jgi:hypothetical protein
MEENIFKQEKELRDNVRDLLSALAQRDQIYAASRKAFQKLNKECKLLMFTILKKIIEKEKEALATRQKYLEKFEEKVNCIDLDQDELEFIESHVGEYSNDGELILQSQALSILGDIQILERQHAEMRNSLSPPAPVPPTPPSSIVGTSASVPPVSNCGEGISTATEETSSSSSLLTPVPVSAAPSTESIPGSHLQMEQAHQSFSTLFYLSDWSIRNTSPTSTPCDILAALKIKANIQRGSSSQPSDNDNLLSAMATTLPHHASAAASSAAAAIPDALCCKDDESDDFNEVERAISHLCQLCGSTEGRKLFVNVLNQFRSKKVEVGLGFAALGAVVWFLLTKCLHVNDVHNAKIVMILSQV